MYRYLEVTCFRDRNFRGTSSFSLLTLILLSINIQTTITGGREDCGKIPKLLQLPVRKAVAEDVVQLWGRCNLFYTLVCLEDGITCDYNNQCCNGPCNEVCAKEIVNASAKSYREAEPDLGSPESVIDDAWLEVPQIIVKYGYPFELHEVTTEDGYILSVHRIPYGRAEDAREEPKKHVIWLQHGLLGDSSNYLLNTVDKALGYVFADLGYDVWIGNARGSRYSRKHVSLTPDNDKFWDFSFDEMGKYDIPVVLNYILNITGQPKIDYIGHSMGNVMFYIAMIEHPELQSKIRLQNSLAPAAYVTHLKPTVVKTLLPMLNPLSTVLTNLEHGEFSPNNRLIKSLESTFCKEKSEVQHLCMDALYEIVGYDEQQINSTLVPFILGHFPGITSARSIIHYGQSAKYSRFSKFDFGEKANLKMYGTKEPPTYNLSQVTVPVAIWYGENDLLVQPEDIQRTAGELGNVVQNHRIQHEKYSHMDFLWAKDNDVLLNEKLVDIIQSYASSGISS